MIINHARSVERGKIIARASDGLEKFEQFTFYFINVLFLGVLFLPLYMLIISFLRHDTDPFLVFLALVPLALGAYLALCLANITRLVRVDGADIATNKKLVLPIINGYYPKMNFEWDGDILIGSRPEGYFRSGYGAVLIFDDEAIYINIQSFNRNGLNPWLAFTNINRAKEIGEFFKEELRYGSKKS